MNNIIKKLTNTKTLIAVVSSVILILSTLGVEIDNEQVMTVVKAVCAIGIALGVMNDKGMQTIKWNK